MTDLTRRMIIVGNWKMFTDREDGPVLAAELVHQVDDLGLDIDLVV